MSVRTQKWTALSGVHAPPTRGQTEARGAQKFCAVSFPHRGWCVLVCVYPMYRVPYMNVPVAVPTRDAGLAARPARWCIVTSDNRPRDGTPLSAYWVLHAAINEIYAESHGYGYLYVHLSNRTTPCEYLTKGGSSWRRRDATWCKVPAVAHVLLHGLPSGRQCSNVLYLDSDAHVSNWSLSIDDYLARAKDRGDEALQDDRWQILFSSNYWFEPDSLNTGAWFIRNTASACGLLRFWWGRTQFPNYDVRLPYEIGLEQEVMRRMYVFGRPWGERVRLLPTARFYRRDDYAWRQKGREHSSWAATRAPERSYSHDDFIHHGQKRHARDIAWLVQTLRQAQSSLRRDPGGFDCWCVPDRDSCDASGHIVCSSAVHESTCFVFVSSHVLVSTHNAPSYPGSWRRTTSLCTAQLRLQRAGWALHPKQRGTPRSLARDAPKDAAGAVAATHVQGHGACCAADPHTE